MFQILEDEKFKAVEWDFEHQNSPLNSNLRIRKSRRQIYAKA